jgi:hypothetical protein
VRDAVEALVDGRPARGEIEHDVHDTATMDAVLEAAGARTQVACSDARVAGREQPCSRTVVLERGLPPAEGWLWVADESIWTVDDALVLRDGPWHVWTLHPSKARGEDATRRIAEVAADRGIACVLGSNSEFGPGAVALHRVAASLPDLPAAELLGHDHACAVLIDGWTSDVLPCHDGLLVPR